MKIAPFLSFQNQLKVFHWQTFSYAEHKALGKAYEDLDELFDTFIETYYGKYGKTPVKVEYTISAESYGENRDIKKTISSIKRDLISYVRSELSDSDSDLKNIVDEIEGRINHLQYLLDLK
jgi:DNA-binding ferritin-like protein